MEWIIILLVAATIICWGVWGFFYKIGVEKVGVWSTVFISSIAFVIMDLVIICILYLQNVHVAFDSPATYFIIAGAVSGLAGGILWYFLLERVPVSIAVPLTAIYPAVTVLLGILVLSEEIKVTHAAGILFAIAAGILLSL